MHYTAKAKIITAEKIYNYGDQVPAEVIKKYKHLAEFVDGFDGGADSGAGVTITETTTDDTSETTADDTSETTTDDTSETTADDTSETTADDTSETTADAIYVDKKEKINGESDWTVTIGDLTFKVSYNQVRDDGELTAGGVEKYHAAQELAK